MSEKPKTKTVWIAWTNSDLTEGRGYSYPLAISESRACAIRLGRNCSVMGTDCYVEPFESHYIGGRWLAPVRFDTPEPIDIEDDKKHEARLKAIVAAKTAGLSDETIAALSLP